MAATTNLLHFQPIVKACANPNSGQNFDGSRRKPSSSGNWWSPLFGWSPSPDYFESSGAGTQSPEKMNLKIEKPSPKFAPGCFTEEKAKRLRMLTKDSAFHDVMYHSAIASRLASDFPERSDLSD